jgi:phage-related protein (TIGR01555 family)
MINFLRNLFSEKKEEAKPVEEKERLTIFSTDLIKQKDRGQFLEDSFKKSVQKGLESFISTKTKMAMDSSCEIKSQFRFNASTLPDAQYAWYSCQGFIGYQTCAILSQNWLIMKCCSVPAQDATRNGYEITVNDGTDVGEDVLNEMVKLDVKYDINYNMTQFVTMGNIFGIRVALFVYDSDVEDFYEKPFNIDGVKKGSYRGISQIDPYWMTPELDLESTSNPASKDFYEPTWWRIGNKRYHKSHLVIMRCDDLPDILKPTYNYGGVPVPQKIYERVYCAERTSNEAPLLALSKRTTIYKTDLEKALAKEADFEGTMVQWSYLWNNHGIKVIGLDDEAQQFDTSLADLDTVIMTQYQLVAAAANVPAAKLLGTTPKGFNSTGEFEESSYHEYLESIQSHFLTPLLNRHHMLLIHSEISVLFGINQFTTVPKWDALDSMTKKEQAEVKKLEADTGQVLIASGAISPEDERARVISDKESGYSGLDKEIDIEESEIGAIENDPEEQE